MESTVLEHGNIFTCDAFLVCICVSNAKTKPVLTIGKQKWVLKGHVAWVQAGNPFQTAVFRIDKDVVGIFIS